MHHIVIFGLIGPTVFFHIFSQKARFYKKILSNMEFVFRVSLQFLPEKISFWEELREIWLKMYIDFHVKYPLFLSNFNDTWMLSADFRKRFK
jgi:hypothetical protein